MVAAMVKIVEGDEDSWILAEVVSFNPVTRKYEVFVLFLLVIIYVYVIYVSCGFSYYFSSDLPLFSAMWGFSQHWCELMIFSSLGCLATHND